MENTKPDTEGLETKPQAYIAYLYGEEPLTRDQEIALLRDTLTDAALQIEHMEGQLGRKTGTSTAVLMRIGQALRRTE